MGNSAYVEMGGVRELERTLRLLGDQAMPICRRSIRKASRPFIAAARRNLKSRGAVDTGTLYKSIKAVVRTYPGRVVVVMGPERKTVTINGKKKNAANYASLVEFGHRMVRGGTLPREGKRRTHRHAGRQVGTVRAKPFMRPAWMQTRVQAQMIMASEMRRGVESAARTLAVR